MSTVFFLSLPLNSFLPGFNEFFKDQPLSFPSETGVAVRYRIFAEFDSVRPSIHRGKIDENDVIVET